MRKRLNIRMLISMIIIGEFLLFIVGILYGFLYPGYGIEGTIVQMILYPMVLVALAIIIWFQNCLTDKIKEDALLDKK